MNHSCDPNTMTIDITDVDELYDAPINMGKFHYKQIACKDIKEGEAITCNYLLFYETLAEPFECHCGSNNCCGHINGFKNLPLEKQKEYSSLMNQKLYTKWISNKNWKELL